MQTALILQGGGALGAYEFGVLKRLYEEPGFDPQIISGVSIGAINAVGIVGAKKDPMATLEEMWDRFSLTSAPFIPDEIEQLLSLYGNPGYFSARYDYINARNWTSFYDTEPLKQSLRELVDFDKVNRKDAPHLIVAATNVQTGQIEYFDNREAIITPDHIMASGGLPPGFPMIQIDGQFYWDGGLFDNTPLLPAIKALDPNPDIEKRIIVVDLFPRESRLPQNMLEVFDRTSEIIFANKFRHDVSTAHKVNEFVEVMQAINQSLPLESPIRKLPGYRRLNQYMLINDIVVIENREPEVVSGPFDFSRKTIRRRIEAGYRDAARKLEEWDWNAASAHSIPSVGS